MRVGTRLNRGFGEVMRRKNSRVGRRGSRWLVVESGKRLGSECRMILLQRVLFDGDDDLRGFLLGQWMSLAMSRYEKKK